MANIILPRVGSMAPQQGAQVDYGNAIAQGLTSLWWGDNNLIAKAVNQTSLVGTRDISRYGIGRKLNGTTDTMSLPSGALPSVTASRFALVRVGAASAIASISGAGNNSLGFRLNAAAVQINQVLNSTLLSAAAAVVANEYCSLAMSCAVGDQKIYKNGQLIASGVSAASGSDATNTPVIGGTGNGSQSFDGTIYLHASWNRILSPSEVKALNENPWQLFKAPNRNIWVSASSAVNTPVNPAAGNIAVTGYAPSIAQTANKSVSPSVGNIGITGYAPVVLRTANQSVAPSVGSISITGYAPSVTQAINQSIAPSVGNIALTGYAPVVSQTANQSITPSSGTIALTGYAPTTTQTANQDIRPSVGSLVITGYAPSVVQALASTNVSPSSGSIVITGYAPSVAQSGSTGGGGSHWRVLYQPKTSKKAEKLAEILEVDDEEKTKKELLAKIKRVNEKYYRALKTVPKAKQAEVFKEAWDLIKHREVQQKDEAYLIAELFYLF